MMTSYDQCVGCAHSSALIVNRLDGRFGRRAGDIQDCPEMSLALCKRNCN